LAAAPSRSASAKGRRTSESILATALKIMGEEGYASLTVGRIAAATGMRKGNLQYHFPTKAGLLRAVLRHQVDEQKRRWLTVLEQAPMDPEQRLRHMVRYEIDLGRDEVVKAQANEKWAFAAHDDLGGQITADWYRWAASQYAELIGDLDKRSPVSERKARAACLYSLLEGAAPFFGRTGRTIGPHGDVGATIEAFAIALARGLVAVPEEPRQPERTYAEVIHARR
jgi:AcrR family transcriptional regulator